MAILSASLLSPTPPCNHLSSLGTNSDRSHVHFLPVTSIVSRLSFTTTITPFKTTMTIRMGGGPRTYPGGVSKWQWKRMQAKKANQLLKARLARERQIYEMRKRAELKAAVSELERPWEVVEKAPALFSVSADEQLKVLADRFQKPGGFDMWSDRDGPDLFKPDGHGLPSSRVFPKGVVHSIKLRGKIEKFNNDGSNEFGTADFGLGRGFEDEGDPKTAAQRHAKKMRNGMNGEKNFSSKERNSGKGCRSKLRKNYNGTGYLNDSTKVGYVRGSSRTDHRRNDNVKESRRRSNGKEKFEQSNSVVFDLTLQKHGGSELQQENRP